MEIILNIASNEERRQVALTADSTTIGRSASSAIVIADKGMSRQHGVFHREAEGVRLVDQQSVNGSYVNCELVPPGGTLLKDGDEIFMGHHTVVTVSVKSDPRRPSVAEKRTSGWSLSLLFVAPLLIMACLMGAVVLKHIQSRARADEQELVTSAENVRPEKPKLEIITSQPTPAPTSSPDSTSSEEVVDAPIGPRKLYKSLNDEEKREFIKERAGRIAIMMGKRPYAFTPDALEYIKFWLEAFAGRVGNNRTGLWRGDTRFILERGRTHAPVIIRAFKENRVPPVIGLYIPFIETEYTNIQSNNAAGAAGLFQFLGPTAEHYGVASADRTDVAKMAPAAARYFRDNIMSFGDDSMSVALAIAAYNRAPESVKRDLRNVLSAANNEDKERNFWTLIANQGKLDHFFQSENKNYVPRFFAAGILGETPWAFGIEMRPLSTYTTIDSQPSAGSPN